MNINNNDNHHDNTTTIQNFSVNNQIQQQPQQQDLPLHTYLEYENLNKQNCENELSLKRRRIKQQIQWENQLQASYEWRDDENRKYRWLARREYEKEEDFNHELEDEVWDQLEKLEQEEDEQKKRREQWEQEQLKLYLAVEQYEKDYIEQLRQINFMEEINEEEKVKRQDTLNKQLEHLEQCEQLEHTAQLQFAEWIERFQQQQQKHQLNIIQSDKLVIHNRSIEDIEKNIPFFRQKQSNIHKQNDSLSNTIIQLIEKYNTPMHVIVRQSMDDEKYNANNDDTDDDDYDDNDDDRKNGIKIIDDDKDDEDLSQQKKEEETSLCNLRQRHPLIFIQKKKHIRRIQRELESTDYVLLKVYKGHTYYLCQKREMEQKVAEHMIRTDAYTLIRDNKYGEKYKTFVSFPLHGMIRRVTAVFDELYKKKLINNTQLVQMYFDESKVKMDYLSFQPNIRQKGVHFQPIMTCDLGPTINISRHLQRLLQPIYDEAAKKFTYFKGADAIYALELYAQKGYLRSNTLFITIRINDLCTTFSHNYMIQTLEEFLNIYLPERQIQGITIETILELVGLVLRNQVFFYHDNIYQQIKGCASGSPLTVLLADIYMFYWQQNLVNKLMEKNELFGRCLDEIFLTWNDSIDAFRILLDSIIHQHQHLSPFSLTISVDKKVNYLDAEISHINGRLRTKVHHNLRIEPYSLPYVFNQLLLSIDNDTLISSLIEEAVIRAVLCCSSVVDFEREQYFIHWSLGLNHRPTLSFYIYYDISREIDKCIRRFNNGELYFNLDDYVQLRRRVRQYDNKRIQMEIERRQLEQEKETWYIVYPFKSNLFNYFKQDFERFWLRCCNYDNTIDLNKFNLQFIRRSKYPPSI